MTPSLPDVRHVHVRYAASGREIGCVSFTEFDTALVFFCQVANTLRIKPFCIKLFADNASVSPHALCAEIVTTSVLRDGLTCIVSSEDAVYKTIADKIKSGAAPESLVLRDTLLPFFSLPKGWTLCWSKSRSRPYFHDHNSGVNTWNEPRNLPRGPPPATPESQEHKRRRCE